MKIKCDMQKQVVNNGNNTQKKKEKKVCSTRQVSSRCQLENLLGEGHCKRKVFFLCVAAINFKKQKRKKRILLKSQENPSLGRRK